MRGHRNLIVWQRAMGLVERVYEATRGFPRDENWGLRSQLRRAAVSVPSNIAEGYGRGGADYRRFVGIAYGSLLEMETQIEVAARLQYLGARQVEEFLRQTGEVGRMLNALRRKLGNEP